MVAMELKCVEINSNQDWTKDPDMIAVKLNGELLLKTEKCIAFMNDNDVNVMLCWWAIGYELFALASELADEDIDGKAIVVNNGSEYVEFDPPYSLEGCHVKFYKDGDIQAELPFKHTNDKIWFTIGNIVDLKQKFQDVALSVAA
jgi:hypothetical protein